MRDCNLEILSERLKSITEIARWVWLVNLIVTIGALATGHFGVAAITGFTFLATLVAAAIGRKLVDCIAGARENVPRPHTIRSSADKSQHCEVLKRKS